MLKNLTFDQILNNASSHYLSLPESKQQSLKESLSHGKALLDNNSQMKAYIHLYGDIHRKKLMRAYYNIPLEIFNNSINLIDWGCGQGIASILFTEYMKKNGISLELISNLYMIEPSRYCLAQATNYISMCCPELSTIAIPESESDINIKEIVLKSNVSIHLLSNIIDMPEFEGDGVMNVLHNNHNKRHLIICVSPFYPEEGRGRRMKEFGNRLINFRKIYEFEKHIDDWNEDFSCQIHIYDNKFT